ncbi:MAG: hypothetical protein V1811_00325 [Candidatus Micrarchaeota archaeon]
MDLDKDAHGFVEIPIAKLHGLGKKPRLESKAETQEDKPRESGERVPELSDERKAPAEEPAEKPASVDELNEEDLDAELDAALDEPKRKQIQEKRNVLTQGLPDNEKTLYYPRDLPKAYREQAARDVLPVENKQVPRLTEDRENAADLARKIYADRQKEKREKSVSGRVKGFFSSLF